ncbi:ribosome biogenesis protein ytm1 [Coemansia sp. RSA 2607]|nr:ribosome biogenesis protein ytm1 [Coemansia sp. RSA 2607]KAJ2397415.1 ribosome biogenesis protein ytm1 [Coemansia sp. RSA 2603]
MDARVDYLLGKDSNSDASTSPLTLSSAQQLSASLSTRLSQSAQKLHAITHSAPAVYHQATSAATQATQQITALLSGVEHLQQLADTRHALTRQIDEATHDTENTSKRLQHSEAMLVWLRKIAEVFREISGAEESVDAGKLTQAAQGVARAVELAEEFSGSRVGRLLEERTAGVGQRIWQALVEELERTVVVETQGTEKISITCVAKADKENVADLVASAKLLCNGDAVQESSDAVDDSSDASLAAAADAALAQIGCDDNGENTADSDTDDTAIDVLQVFGDRIVDRAVTPLLQHGVIDSNCSENTITFKLGAVPEGNASAACQAVLQALKHIEQHTDALPWTSATLQRISALAAQKYISDVAIMTREQLALLSEAPATQAVLKLEDALVERAPMASRPAAQAVACAAQRYARERSTRLLERARELGSDPSLALYDATDASVWPQGLPACSVSQAAVELVHLLRASEEPEEELSDAVAVYLAISGLVHAEPLRLIPGVQVLRANDCLLLAAHVGSLLGSKAADSLTAAAAMCLQAADQAHEALVRRQGDELAKLAAPSAVFERVLGEEARGTRERALKQTERAVKALQKALTPPRTAQAVCSRLMRQCIDEMFAAVVRSVVDLDDIGAEESQVLAEYCRAVGELDQSSDRQQKQGRLEADDEDDLLLLDDDVSNKVEHVSVAADRLHQLADVLELSRADILARRRAGLLVNFTATELVHLVKALFSDTPERQRDIDILQAL